MKAHVGDRLLVRGRTVGQSEHVGQVIEVRGSGEGDPPYLVRYEHGGEALVFPGADTLVQHQQQCSSP